MRIKYLLTHPIVADLRASQENRRPTEIGLEILRSLEVLKSWGTDCANVRLYLGTPTCFAIKTTRQMLLNPYPYVSVSFDSPCLTLEYSPDGGADRRATSLTSLTHAISARGIPTWQCIWTTMIRSSSIAVACFSRGPTAWRNCFRAASLFVTGDTWPLALGGFMLACVGGWGGGS